jgi:transglutaminase-like putative cysteine protease
MSSNSSLISILTVLAFVLASCQSSPDTETSKEVSIADVEDGIRTYIEKATLENEGYFNVTNDSLDLDMKLVRVHTEYLSILGPNEYFACVDLATTDGDVYDVDFFLTGEPGDMEVTRTDVHKLNGKPFYTWKRADDNTWFTVPVEQATEDLLGVLRGKDRFTFQYQVDLPKLTGPTRFWLPIAQSDRFQQIEITRQELPVEGIFQTEAAYGNQFLFLTLGPEHSDQQIVLEYSVERLEKSAYREDNPDLDLHLAATPLLPVGGDFWVIADSVITTKQANNPLAQARALYDYVIENVRYAKQGKYGTADAVYACDAKSGNCTEFHSLFISLARSAGIPARFAVGAAIPSSRDDGGVNGYHCWAEFYAEGKWWPVDISEANKYSDLATYYFGHHPANRIEFSKGRNLSLDPRPASGTVPFFVYPILEIDGEEATTPRTTFTFVRTG